jgi:hypothetical protein
MPSAGSVTDLVIFAGFALASMLVILIFIKFTPIGQKMSQNNEPPLDYTKPPPQRSQEDYVDPVSAKSLKIWYLAFSVAIVLSFVYYFILKGGFFTGN